MCQVLYMYWSLIQPFACLTSIDWTPALCQPLWTLGSPTTSGLPKVIKWLSYAPVWTTVPESPEKVSRNRPLLEVSIWLSRRWSQRSPLTWKSSASMKSVNPCGITEQWGTQATLQKAQLWGSGAGRWRMAKTRCSARQCLCENSNPSPSSWLIYGTVGKQLPEQHVPPLDY